MSNGDGQQVEGGQPQPPYLGMPVPHLYFNGFDLGSSLSDMGCLLLLNGQPQATLSMSFTTAKTLAVKLNAAVEAFEAATEHTVMTMDDVRAGYEKSNVSNKNP